MSHHATPEELAAAAKRDLAAILERQQALTPKDRRAIPLQEMPSQPPSVRRANMQEVALGYTAEQAQLESLRCLQCRTAPCVDGPEFDGHLVDFDNLMTRLKAYKHHEDQARHSCNLDSQVRRLEERER